MWAPTIPYLESPAAQQRTDRALHNTARPRRRQPLMRAQRLPRRPFRGYGERRQYVAARRWLERCEFRVERTRDFVGGDATRPFEARGQRWRERLVQHGRAPNRRDRLQHLTPRRDERLDALAKRPLTPQRRWYRESAQLPLGRRRVQRFQIVEVMEHAAKRHPRPIGDPLRCRTQVPFLDQLQQRLNDRIVRAGRPRRAPVDRIVNRSLAAGS